MTPYYVRFSYWTSACALPICLRLQTDDHVRWQRQAALAVQPLFAHFRLPRCHDPLHALGLRQGLGAAIHLCHALSEFRHRAEQVSLDRHEDVTGPLRTEFAEPIDQKSTRLNSSH